MFKYQKFYLIFFKVCCSEIWSIPSFNVCKKWSYVWRSCLTEDLALLGLCLSRQMATPRVSTWTTARWFRSPFCMWPSALSAWHQRSPDRVRGHSKDRDHKGHRKEKERTKNKHIQQLDLMYKKNQILLGTFNRKQVVFFFQCPSHKSKTKYFKYITHPHVVCTLRFSWQKCYAHHEDMWVSNTYPIQCSYCQALNQNTTRSTHHSASATLPTQAKHVRKNKATSCKMSWTHQSDLSRSFCSSRCGTGWMTSSPFRATRSTTATRISHRTPWSWS